MSEADRDPIEEMAAFFDARAAGYDEHIRGYVFGGEVFNQFYDAVSAAIEPTEWAIRVLDLGCGTGLELEALFARAPNAQITGVDVAEGMLAGLRATHRARMDQITLVTDSYLTMSLGTQAYDYVVSVLSMHHVLHATKRALYARICAALKPGGKYIEGDSVTKVESEGAFLAEYDRSMAEFPGAEDGDLHVDVPFSLETQRRLLLEAGFRDFELLWERDSSWVWNAAVYAVTA